jgi:hypothetical protein
MSFDLIGEVHPPSMFSKVPPPDLTSTGIAQTPISPSNLDMSNHSNGISNGIPLLLSTSSNCIPLLVERI